MSDAEGEAAEAIRLAETALARQDSLAAQVDLQVVAAVLNAHLSHADGTARLDRLQREIEAAVDSRPDLDTAAGARSFQCYLIEKLRDIRAVVDAVGLDATSKASLAAALASLYASTNDADGSPRPAEPKTPGELLGSPPPDEPAPDDRPEPAATTPATPPPPAMPSWGGLPSSGMPLGGGQPPLVPPGLPALDPLPSDHPDPPSETEPVPEPDPVESSDPEARDRDLAPVISAAVAGTPIVDAFRRQGITIPAPGTPIAAPVQPDRVVAGDVGLFADRHALALGNGKALLDQQIAPIANVSGPGFIGWLHPPAQDRDHPSPAPVAQTQAQPPAADQ